MTGGIYWHNNTPAERGQLVILERSLMSCHAHRFLLLQQGLSLLHYPSGHPVIAKELQGLSRPCPYYFYSAYVAKKITLCVCVCRVIDFAR